MSRAGSPTRFTPRRMRRLLNLYPPFLFQRVRIARIAEGFLACDVRVKKSFLTRNLQGTTFGGTIYSAADPIYALLLWQAVAHRGCASRPGRGARGSAFAVRPPRR